MRRLLLFIISSLLLFTACDSTPSSELVAVKPETETITAPEIDAQLKEGDLIFHASTSPQSKAIQLVTHSDYSHVGIVLKKNGKWMVLEAVQPVKYTLLQPWIKRGQNAHFVVKRIKGLAPSVIPKMKQLANRYLGKPYDSYFGWSNERIYCSELVWKLYQQTGDIKLGERQQLKDFDLAYPEVYIKLKERYGDRIPWEEMVISPAAIFHAPQLVTVPNPAF